MAYKEWKNIIIIFIFIGISAALYIFSSGNFNKSKPKDVFLNTNIDKIPVPLKPQISLLGKAQISYKGGVVNRNNNIEIGIARINGTVIPPGGTFSFLETLGPVLASDGFEEAKSFYKGEVILGLGGGLCHVSSTLFQSVLDAGLPIVERHSHTFAVPFYQIGLDATISNIGPDLKFLNDTGHEIEIKGYTQDKAAIFEIYGVSDKRISSISDVEISDWKEAPPTQFIATREIPVGERKCEQAPQAGYTAKRIYKIMYPNNQIKEQSFKSLYKPLNKICYVGVDDATDFTGCFADSNYSHITGVKCPKE